MSANYTPDEFIAMFETLAREIKYVSHSDSQRHYGRGSVDEMLGGAKPGGIHFPALVITTPVINVDDNRADNVHHVWKTTVGIVASVIRNDFADAIAKQNATYGAIDQLMAWMYAKKRELPFDRRFVGMDPGMWEIYFISGLYDGTYLGCFVDIELPIPHHYALDASAWNNIPA